MNSKDCCTMCHIIVGRNKQKWIPYYKYSHPWLAENNTVTLCNKCYKEYYNKTPELFWNCKICNIFFSLNVEYCLIPTTNNIWDNICLHCLQEKRETHICNCQICKDLKKEF